MTLEIFKACFGGGHGTQTGFILNNKLYLEDSSIDEDSANDIYDRFYQTKCQLISYNKFELDREPKDFRWFKWLIFHNSGTFLSKVRNKEFLRNRIEEFLNFN